ncbi:MAG TPA: energy-coupling factor transporter transmembrane protein EcfT [Clostridia bacterium]|nr:energy-coupling factor transporter transmembrane protein EcfT [Clostridia bacterium]
MRYLSLYQEGNSLLHKIDPITKLLFVIIAILVPIIINTLTMALAFFIISTLLVFVARAFKRTLPIISFSSLVIITVLFIQGLFYLKNQTPFFTLGPFVFYKEGLLYATGIAIRIFNIINAVAVLIFTTKPSDLIEALVKKGVSPKIGYVFSSVLQIIPQMMSIVDTILDAQKARGLETEGSFTKRAKAFIPLIGPAVLNSLISTKERAMALEVRGFNSKKKKTFLNEVPYNKYSNVLQVALIAILVFSIIWRIISW